MTAQIKNESSVQKAKKDLALVYRVSQGDKGAQRQYILRLMPLVKRISSYMLKNHTDALDLSQNTLIRLLDKAGTYSGDSSLEVWAGSVTTRMALSYLDKKKRRRVINDIFLSLNKHSVSSEQIFDDVLAKHIFHQLLQKIKPAHRAVLILKHVECYSVKEMADILLIPENTVRERLRTARAAIKKSVKKNRELMEWFFEGGKGEQ